jgi:hypothetical protein
MTSGSRHNSIKRRQYKEEVEEDMEGREQDKTKERRERER